MFCSAMNVSVVRAMTKARKAKIGTAIATAIIAPCGDSCRKAPNLARRPSSLLSNALETMLIVTFQPPVDAQLDASFINRGGKNKN